LGKNIKYTGKKLTLKETKGKQVKWETGPAGTETGGEM
jgi:hypothetical protein